MQRFYLELLFVFIFFGFNCASAKEADFAGSWYSASHDELKRELEAYLEGAQVRKIDGKIIGIIVPHAGLRASGPVAGYAYKAVKDFSVNKIIVVGFSHRFYLPGKIAVFNDESFITPLGPARIDKALSARLIAYDDAIQDIPSAFKEENSIELEIPFIQIATQDTEITLIAICDQTLRTCQILSNALYDILKNENDFLIIASSDMCHYLPYETANKQDARTIEAIKAFEPGAFYDYSLESRHELMCGYGAVYTVMDACKRLGADKVEVLKYANSGDTLGSKDRVVGYLSAAFVNKGEGMFNQAQKNELLRIARSSIEQYLKNRKKPDVETDYDILRQNMGAFVTLHKNGGLRGCIGNMAAVKPLCLTVRDMAIAAATQDTRFNPVTLEEMEDIDIEISALSPMEKIDDYKKIEAGKHGVLVQMGVRSGVYLPQVAVETGWNRDEFMNSLCGQKAGIPQNAWKTGQCDMYIFTAEVFGEKK